MTKIETVYPRLVVADAAAAIAFYRTVFDADEIDRHTSPDGKIVHAELSIGGVTVAVKDEDDGDPAPTTLGGSPVIMAVYVHDARELGDRIVAEGGTVIYPIQDRSYGQRGGRLADPYGHLWMIAERRAGGAAAEPEAGAAV